MRKTTKMLFVLLAAVLASSTVYAAETTFKAKLTPKEEMVSPKSKASGTAEFKLSKDGKTLSYTLKVKNIRDANAAHIHKGRKGEAGPPLVALFNGERKGKFSGTLSEGTITENDLLGDLQGKPLEELLILIKAEDVYVNVHTDANPDGEIRGQIK